MKYALISARQLIEVYAALTTSLLSVKGKDFNLVKEAMSHLESLKPSDPVAYKHTKKYKFAPKQVIQFMECSENTLMIESNPNALYRYEFTSTPLYEMEQSK